MSGNEKYLKCTMDAIKSILILGYQTWSSELLIYYVRLRRIPPKWFFLNYTLIYWVHNRYLLSKTRISQTSMKAIR